MDTRSPRVILAGLLVVALFMIGHYAIGKDEAQLVFDSLVVGLAVTIVLTNAHKAIKFITNGIRDGGENMLVAWWGTWTCLLGLFLYRVWYVGSGREEWIRLLPIPGLISALLFCVAAIGVLAPVNLPRDVPKPNSFAAWLVAVGIGCATAATLITLGLTHAFNASGD